LFSHSIDFVLEADNGKDFFLPFWFKLNRFYQFADFSISDIAGDLAAVSRALCDTS
jgi:hypothetical protein